MGCDAPGTTYTSNAGLVCLFMSHNITQQVGTAHGALGRARCITSQIGPLGCTYMLLRRLVRCTAAVERRIVLACRG